MRKSGVKKQQPTNISATHMLLYRLGTGDCFTGQPTDLPSTTLGGEQMILYRSGVVYAKSDRGLYLMQYLEGGTFLARLMSLL